MSTEQLFDSLKDILTTTFGVTADDVTPEATFESLDLDSLDLVELTLVIEEEVGVKLEDEQLENIKTVGDAVHAVAVKATVSA